MLESYLQSNEQKKEKTTRNQSREIKRPQGEGQKAPLLLWDKRDFEHHLVSHKKYFIW